MPMIFLSCDELFGRDQLQQRTWDDPNENETMNNSSVTFKERITTLTASSPPSSLTCLEHQQIQWKSCWIAKRHAHNDHRGQDQHQQSHVHSASSSMILWIDPHRIQGSFGGEDAMDVRNRPEATELLSFSKGSLRLSTLHQERLLQEELIPRFSGAMTQLLQTATLLTDDEITMDNSNVQLRQHSDDSTNTITLLVQRGNYANPCMALLSMYNVYIVLRYLVQQSDEKSFDLLPIQIIWLDGHAASPTLDSVWQQLFQTKPIPIRQLASSSWNNTSSNNNSPFATNHHENRSPQTDRHRHLKQQEEDNANLVPLHNAIVVNTMSAIGDEGYGRYSIPRGPILNGVKNKHCQDATVTNSTLIEFRDFVLNRYGIRRKSKQDLQSSDEKSTFDERHPANEMSKKKVVTLLARKDYMAHPRSDGQTDRVLVNITQDVSFLEHQFPDHTLRVVSFEDMDFFQQLTIVSQSDVFVTVHGAGNIHVLFLPSHALVWEFFPKGYTRRRRFQFLAECVCNLTYVAKKAWIVGYRNNNKVTVRLHPVTKKEEHTQNFP